MNQNIKLKRATRKRLFSLKLWNFSRIKPRSISTFAADNTLSLSILSGNVQSCKNKFDEIYSTVLHHNCCINFFTESWLNSDVSSETISIPGFQTVRRDRDDGQSNSHGGGILGYISGQVTFEIIKIVNPDNLEVLPIFLTDYNLLLIAIYHPFWNNPDKHNLVLDHLFNIVNFTKESFVKFQYKMLLVGDLNDLRHHIYLFADIFKLKNIVSFNTRRNNSLDCVYTNEANKYSVTQLAPVGKSDHCLIKCAGIDSRKKKKIFYKHIPDYSPSNKLRFDSLMKTTDFSISNSIDNIRDLEFQFDNLLAKIHSIYDTCFPLRKVKSHQHSLPWINDSIRICIANRDKAYRKKQQVQFKHYRQKVKSLITQSKDRYCRSINNLQSSKSWQKVHNIIGLKKRQVTQSTNVHANSLLSHFTSIKPQDDFMVDDISNAVDEQVKITAKDVLAAISKLKKGGGKPYVPPWIIKNYSYILVQPLCIIFQASMNQGFIPSSMKIASITPVPKIKKPLSPDDYRPITCASPFLKLLEAIVYKIWLKDLINEHNFADQFAFIPLKGRGCTTALLSIYGNVLQHVDKGEFVNVLLVDLSKAFDRAATSHILNQLTRLCATKQCLLWISNFLQNRQVSVQFNGACSETQILSGGTPQGSLISPLLFAVLCHTLTSSQSNFSYYKYADDLTVVHHTNSPTNTSDLQREIDHIVQWCQDNSMVINGKKTKIMHISNRKQPHPPRVSIDGNPIEVIQSCKLLGLSMQANLKWNEQVKQSISKASKLLFPILQLKRGKIQTKTLIQLYQLLVRPHLTYAFPVCTNMTQLNKQKIVKMERRFYTLIGAKPDLAIREFIDKGCLKLAKEVISYKHHPVRNILEPVAHRRTRAQKELKAPFARTSLMKNSFIKLFA